MNILQSFMGCMYPGIRTESIESVDHDYQICRFQVTNIDDERKEVSRGELQLTDKDLIYFRPSRHPVLWPICCIRKFGCNKQGNIFIFESGRRCVTGEAIFGFHLSKATDLVNQLRERIEKAPPNEIDSPAESSNQHHDILLGDGPRPLNPEAYAQLDFGTTEALNGLGQAHAARRGR